jgi:DNA-binding LytR/AlgR family response regulator
MWIRIRAVIIEDEPLAAQYLAELLDETCQVEVVGSATEGEAGLYLCAEVRPDVVFVDINLPGKDGVSLAKQLAMLPQPPAPGLYDGKRKPRHGRLPAGGGGLSIKTFGSGASH